MSTWAASTAISLNTIIKATTTQYSGLRFKCIVAGTTHSSEPEWPNVIGTTINDNTVTWIAVSAVYDSTNKLEPSPYIDLFELRPVQSLHNTSTPVRWHNGANENITGNVEFGGHTYNRIAIEATGFEATTSGSRPRPKLTIANVEQTLTLLLKDINLFNYGNDLAGAEVRRIRTLKKFLDGESDADSSAFLPYEVWVIDRKESENMNIVTFELTTIDDKPNDFVPKRILIGNCCQWIYKSTECSYTGSNYFDKNDVSVSSSSADVCGKRLSSCKKRFGENAELPFGSFPAAGKTQ